jgi:sugar phosphate isomerase/epimerase
MSLPIAVQVYSVRDNASADLYATLKQIKEMGYDGVEFAGLYGNTPADIKAWCDELGLVPISAHVPFVDMLKDPIGVLTSYKEIGCKFVAVPYLVPEHRPEHPNFPYVVEFIHSLCKAAKEIGLKMLYHNHDFEFLKIDGKYALDILYDTIPADLLATELDTCWVNVGGENPSEYIKKYSNRAPIVHLKDFNGQKSDDMYELIGIEKKAPTRPSGFEFRPVGSGLQDFPAILAAAKEAGAEWVVVEQDQATMGLSPMESIKKSIDYLKSFEW